MVKIIGKIKVSDLDGNQEQAAISYFRPIIRAWIECFREDNHATIADHLHELLHVALLREGLQPEYIEFLTQPDWRPELTPVAKDQMMGSA